MSASCVLVFENKLIAAFYLVDKIREDAYILLNTLNASHQTMMLSGDNQSACDKVGKTLSVTQCHGNLSATDKMSIIKEQQKIINDTIEKKLSLSKLQSTIWEKSNNTSEESFNITDMDDDVLSALIEKDSDTSKGNSEGYKLE